MLGQFCATQRRRTLSLSMAVLALTAAHAGATLTINQWDGYPGTDFYGNASNWVHDNVPDTGDQATIYAGPVTLYSSPASIGALFVGHLSAAGQFFTNGFKLNVLDDIDLYGASAGFYAYSAPSGSVSVECPSITLSLGAILQEQTASSKVRVSSNASGTLNGTLSVDATSEVITYGELDTGLYTNNGLLKGGSGASTINATTFTMAGTASQIASIDANAEIMSISATTFNLTDPNTAINVNDYQGNLSLQGSPAGNVGSTVTIGDSSQLTVGSGSWTFGYYTKSNGHFLAEGSVNLDGGPTLARAATINSYAAYVTSVNVNGYGNMVSAEFDGASSVNVAASSYLYVGSPYFRGTTFTSEIEVNGPGTVYFNGNTGIGYSSTGVAYTEVDINAGTNFDWDGTSNTSASCDIQNGELDIYSSTIDVNTGYIFGLYNGYKGALTVEGGSLLNVAGTAWTLYGTANLGPGAIIQGQTMTVNNALLPGGTYSINLNTNGTPAIIQAPFNLLSGSIYMTSGSTIHLDGATTYAGGSVTSAPFISGTQPYGTLTQDGNATVTANTTLFCDTLDMDGTANTATWTINPGVTLTQEAYFLDAQNSTTNPFHSIMTINGGTMAMETSGPAWTLAGGIIYMNQSGISLPYITGDKLILGSGATNGTIIVGSSTTAFISGGLQSGANSSASGNVINVGPGSILYEGGLFGSDANAVLTKTGAGTLSIGASSQSHGAGSIINVNQGELDLNSNAGTVASGTLNLNVSDTVVANSDQHLASLHILSGGLVTMASGANKVLRTSSLIIDSSPTPAGTLDITNDGAIIDYTGASPLTTIAGYIANAYDKGAWDQTGITSSNAKTKAGTTIGCVDDAEFHYSAFDGQSISFNTILLKYTWYGDLNLDGVVNNVDLQLMNTGSGWGHGDLNYDGVDNSDDFALFALGAARQDASIPASVPEPTAMAMLLGAFAPLLRRRRA